MVTPPPPFKQGDQRPPFVAAKQLLNRQEVSWIMHSPRVLSVQVICMRVRLTKTTERPDRLHWWSAHESY